MELENLMFLFAVCIVIFVIIFSIMAFRPIKCRCGAVKLDIYKDKSGYQDYAGIYCPVCDKDLIVKLTKSK